jgi:hypothetical protein
MPSIDKVGGGITITFAPKNDDVREILVELKKSKKVKLTDYICEAIRFYEANKDKMNNDKGDLAEIIKEEVSKQVKSEIEKIEVSKQIKDEIEKILEEKKLTLIENVSVSLEDDLEDVDITEDG